MSDDLLGKKSLSQTAPPLSSLKPLKEIGGARLGGTGGSDGVKSGKSFSKSFTRKTVRLADPLEHESMTIHEPIPSPVSAPTQERKEADFQPTPTESPDQPKEEKIAKIEKEVDITSVIQDQMEMPQQPSLEPVIEKPADEEDFLPLTLSDSATKLNQIDFTERSSLQARESLIRQQYSSLSLQRVYGKILDCSSIQNSLHVAIMKGDDRLVEEVACLSSLFESSYPFFSPLLSYPQILNPNKNAKMSTETLDKISYRDRVGRTAFHVAAYGSNPRIVDLLFLTSRLHYEDLNLLEINRLKEVPL
jgi:hypothetical protein